MPICHKFSTSLAQVKMYLGKTFLSVKVGMNGLNISHAYLKPLCMIERWANPAPGSTVEGPCD